MKVSVIIPMKNSEKTIVQVLENLYKQTFRDFEVLLIDDNSSDNTFNTVTGWLNKNMLSKRMWTIIKSNHHLGVSKSRNIGLSQAIGEYIVVIDSDDSIQKNLLEKYVQEIELSKTGIVFFSIKGYSKTDGVYDFLNYGILDSKVISAWKAIEMLCNQRLAGYACSFISRKDMWDNVKFNENLRFQEDNVVLVELLLNNLSEKISFRSEKLYIYVKTGNSDYKNWTLDDYSRLGEELKMIVNSAKNKYGISPSKINVLNGLILNVYLSMVVNTDKCSTENRQARYRYCEMYDQVRFTSVWIFFKRSLRLLKYKLL